MAPLSIRQPCTARQSVPCAVARLTGPPAVVPCSSSSRLSSRHRPLPAHAAHAASAWAEGGAVILFPGFLFSARQYANLAADLRRQGFPTEVVPISTTDWLPALRGGSFEWYLQRADALVQEMHARHGRVALVGHSAGGWIARLLLGGEPYQGMRYGRSPLVHTLVTLGTPHHSIEAYPFGRKEESLVGPHVADAPSEVGGSSLKFANYFYPDAESLGGVRVVCACGDTVRGRRLWGSSSSNGSSAEDTYSSPGSDSYASYASVGSMDDGGVKGSCGSVGGANRYDAWLAYESYKSGCGRGDVDGDGVTPLCISHLPGAQSLVLPGVWHVPRRKAAQLWYGDGDVLEHWRHFLLEPHHTQQAATARGAP